MQVTLSKRRFSRWLALALLFCLAGAALADTLQRVRKHGAVRCAGDTTAGFNNLGSDGRPRGFDVDFCRAVAAAVLGRADAIEIQRINSANKYKALARGDVDIAFGMSTWTYQRDVAMGTRFVTPTLFDGQGFMVWSDSKIQRLKDAKGAKVCVQSGTTGIANLKEISLIQNLDLKFIESSSAEQRIERFARRDCEMLTGDRSELAAQRATKAIDVTRWRLLEETISREPLGPYVAHGDERWFAIVRWAMLVPQIAEYRALDTKLLDTLVGKDADSELLRLAGKERGFGAPLGLDDGWAWRILTQVGDYRQIFDRNLGIDSTIRMERGPNRPAHQGGLFMPPSLR
ncbi:MAG TPA: transporter substrate-binding domain-containing protein [Rhodocyclaceae bacterium]|nr:transporter substrate-binding domain-containing protein [Rhodocyclaceae bacterium]